MRDRNGIATSEDGNGHDRIRLGGKDANLCATTQSGLGFGAQAGRQRRRPA
jgi:hypothetical protein